MTLPSSTPPWTQTTRWCRNTWISLKKSSRDWWATICQNSLSNGLWSWQKWLELSYLLLFSQNINAAESCFLPAKEKKELLEQLYEAYGMLDKTGFWAQYCYKQVCSEQSLSGHLHSHTIVDPDSLKLKNSYTHFSAKFIHKINKDHT